MHCIAAKPTLLLVIEAGGRAVPIARIPDAELLQTAARRAIDIQSAEAAALSDSPALAAVARQRLRTTEESLRSAGLLAKLKGARR